MAVRTIPETTDRTVEGLGEGPGEGRADGRERRPDGWGPGRVWLAWGIYFTVLAIVALAALVGT
jgi:hypothetical protein